MRLQLTRIIGDVDMIYQLEHRGRDLSRLCYFWRRSTVGIPAGDNAWGPSALQIEQAGDYGRVAHIVLEEKLSDCGDTVSDAASWETDGDLVEQVEAVAFHDEYLNDDPVFNSEYLDDFEAVDLPRKRSRTEDY